MCCAISVTRCAFDWWHHRHLRVDDIDGGNEAEADYEKSHGTLQETLDAQITSKVANEQELAEFQEDIADTLEIKSRSPRPPTWRKRRLWRLLRRRIARGSRATSTLAVRRGRLRLMALWRPRTPWRSAAMTVMISCETS